VAGVTLWFGVAVNHVPVGQLLAPIIVADTVNPSVAELVNCTSCTGS
jgi:hypothetical protein